MDLPSPQDRQRIAALDRPALECLQLERLNRLLSGILPRNKFYAAKLAGLPSKLDRLDQLGDFPFTTKDELIGEDDDSLAANLTYPLERYVRFHQTSGTRGKPLVILDTADDWQWWINTWQWVLDAAEIGPDDRAMMAFSFGPFIGFWTAYDAVAARGGLVAPGGGMSTLARLQLLRTSRATALFCTPTYAQRLVEVARENAFDLSTLDVRVIVVAGEPGGSIPAIRDPIEAAFGAKISDHCGATEVGPWGFADKERRGQHVIESEFIAEFLSLEGDRPPATGELAQLVLTSLGRFGAPVIRYRTGDIVRPAWPEKGPCRFVLLDGGILGRIDDMLVIRGVNIFPSSIEAILREFDHVVEFRLTARKRGAMDELTLEVEDRSGDTSPIARALETRLGLRVDVALAPADSLPRFEGKGKRFVDER